MREVSYPDLLHNLWNDTMAGIKSAGEYKIVLLTTVAANLPWGPFQGENGFKQ